MVIGNSRNFLAPILFVLVAMPTLAKGSPSFNCTTKNLQNAEKIICDSELVASMDVYMNLIYKAVASSYLVSMDALKAEQLAWLKERNICTDKNCLRDKYVERIDELITYSRLSGRNFVPVSGLFSFIDEETKNHNSSPDKIFHKEKKIVCKENVILSAMPTIISTEDCLLFEANLVPEGVMRVTSLVPRSIRYVYDNGEKLVLTVDVSDAPSKDITYTIEGLLVANDFKHRSQRFLISSTKIISRKDVFASIAARGKMVDENLRPVYLALKQLQAQGEYSNTALILMLENKNVSVTNGSGEYETESRGTGIYVNEVQTEYSNGELKPIVASPNHEIIVGSDNRDSMKSARGDQIYILLDGDDEVRDSWGDDLYVAGEGNDTIIDSWGNDVFYGGSGDDTIIAGYGNDILLFGNNWGHDTVDMTCHTGTKYLVFDKKVDVDLLAWVNTQKIVSKDGNSSITFKGSRCIKIVHLAESLLD
jgi:uncharacterized protein YecT (DUF1311 family)